MAIRRPRRSGRSRTLLPLRSAHVTNSLSCWYCDYKIYAFNEILFSIGQRYSRFLQVWFTVGVIVSFVALVGVTMLLIWGLVGPFYLHKGTYLNSLSISWLFSSSPFMNAGIMFFSTLISVAIHEFGHAIAAASAGIQIEYIAIFLAITFPGALVALNYDLLQNLQRFAALRIYCAGIWHNLMFSAVCGVALFLLPLILYPLYIHGEMPMVLEMPQTSPLNGFLSPGDAIVSVDGSKLRYPSEWPGKMIQINSQLLHKEVSGRKGYCVPNSWLDIAKIHHVVGDNFTCPDDHAMFVKVPCLNSSLSAGISIEDNTENRREPKFCLIARDFVKLKRCGDGWIGTDRRNTCGCFEDESCMEPVQNPGALWVEISYSTPYSLECSQLQRNVSGNTEISDHVSGTCGGTFIFLGDVLTLAHSIYLTLYQPRWSYLSANIPNLLERILSCTLHVSATLGVLNSLPVFFLDGESILEMVLYYITWLNPRRRHKVLRFCLIGGSILCVTVVGRTLFSTFTKPFGY